MSIADVAGGAANTPLLGDGGVPDRPVALVDLDTGGPVAAAIEAAARAPRILIGLGGRDAPADLMSALDLTLMAGPGPRTTVEVADVAAAADAVTAAIRHSPRAAVVLARLLRWSAGLPAADALDAESLAYSTLLGGPEFRRWLDGRAARPPAEVPEPVLVARAGDELHVTLNRPERRNAYGRQVRDALVEALRIAELDPTVARVVLDGAGPCFCAGGDLGEFGTTPDLTTAHLVRTAGGAGIVLHRLGPRAEVRMHGPCVGAGVELPALAARVVAREGTTFRLPELAMGLIPGAGGTVGIPRRIGRWRALWLALTGDEIGLDRALEWGLVDARH